MKRKNALLISYFLISGLILWLVPGAVHAEELTTTADKSVTEEGEPLVPEQFISRPILNRIELGIGYVSDDAYKFGRFNGMQTDDAFIVGDVKIREFADDGRFWRLRGTNLGLASRYLLVEGGLQGSHKFFLEYDELPNYKNNTVQTPFSGVGGNTLTLPAGFDLDTSLKNYELKTRRERLKAGAVFVPRERWQFDVDFSHEDKKGVDVTGAAIADGATQVVGNTSTALIPEPVDYDTDMVNAIIRYAGDDAQVDLKYHVSLFNNNNDSLYWEDPFSSTFPAGNMSLAPDNEFHQLSLTAGLTLPYNSRLTGFVSMGRMTQNQDFEDYTINTAAADTVGDLPRSSLDGEVLVTSAQLKLSTRPINQLRLNAEIRYNERDNKTPVDSYEHVVLDSHNNGLEIENRPYSYKNNRIKLDANYRFNAITSLRGGYKYSEMKRRYTNVEREDTEEDTLYAKWKIKANSTVDVALLAEASQRDGSDYEPAALENPAMRKYNMADRDRTRLGAKIDFMATDKLFLSARVDHNRDDYRNSEIGLTEATQPVYTVDFSYQPGHNITTYGYYTYETISSSQAGFNVSPSPFATADWEADFEDSFDTIGLGAKWTDLGRWDLGADLVYSKSNGSIEMKDLLNPGTEGQYPDTKTELSSVKLWTTYHYSKQLNYKLGLWYEDYSADNWAVDGLQAYDPNVAGILLPGNETLDYNVYVITVSASYRY